MDNLEPEVLSTSIVVEILPTPTVAEVPAAYRHLICEQLGAGPTSFDGKFRYCPTCQSMSSVTEFEV